MKHWIVVIMGIVLGCRSKEVPPQDLESLVGKWRITAYEQKPNGAWIAVSPNEEYSIEVRFDGVLLSSNGKAYCCAPKKLMINGKSFGIVPQKAIPDNPACHLIDCASCESWPVSLSGDTLEIRYCLDHKSRFVKVK